MSEIQKESVKKNGGKRPGAGRKPSTLNGVVAKLPKDTAILILAKIKANQKWIDLAGSRDERIRLEVLKYLTDRAHGKAKQSVEHTGENGGPVQSRILVEFV
jgi:hypothetical protein